MPDLGDMARRWDWTVAQSHGPRTSRPTGTCATGARPGGTRADLPAGDENAPLGPFPPPCTEGLGKGRTPSYCAATCTPATMSLTIGMTFSP